jgi:hypothetical protein
MNGGKPTRIATGGGRLMVIERWIATQLGAPALKQRPILLNPNRDHLYGEIC